MTPPNNSIVAFLARGSKPSAREAERSGKREYCAAFNEALPVQERLEALPKVRALAFAFSTAHIQRAALHSAQSYTPPNATLHPAMYSAQNCTAPSATQGRMQHRQQRGGLDWLQLLRANFTLH